MHTFTVNHQPWMPGPEPPYVVAIVELPEQDGLRLTTNIVNCAPDDVRIGMPVQVVSSATTTTATTRSASRCSSRRPDGRRRARSSGAPSSPASASRDVGRRLYRDPLDLTLDACLAAIDDAGLTTDRHRRHRHLPGRRWTRRRASRAPGVVDVQDALRLDLNWYTGGLELARPARLGDQRVPGGRDRPRRRTCCASAASGRAAPRATRAGRRSCPAAAAEAAELPRQRVHAVDAAVRGAVGRDLDRDDGPAPLPRVRHDARAAGPDRAQRPQERGASTRTRSTATR